MIKCNIGMAYFKTATKELQDYNSLSSEDQTNIIAKFFANLIKFIWLNKMAISVWKEPDSKEQKNILDMFTEIPDAVVLKGKTESDKAYLAFSVAYNSALCTVEIMPYVLAKDKATEEKYLETVSKDLIVIENYISRKITKELVIKFCFETLYGEKVCSVRGDDAVTMYRIMLRATKHYPKFAELQHKEKMKTLKTAYQRGMRESTRNRDIYVFSKALFEIMERSGLADILYKYDWNLGRYKMFERCGKSPNFLPGSTCPRFICYKYDIKSGVEVKTAFLPYDLWELLAKPDVVEATNS